MTIIKNAVEYLSNLWYSIIKITNREGVMKGIVNAKDLACYIKEEYKKYTNGEKDITPIKLQKGLYFCFAYWAGFVNKGKIDGQLSEDVSDVLFEDKIEAWAYGPVVPAVYFNEKLSVFKTQKEEDEAVARVEDIFNGSELLKETINSILLDVFSTTDFKLVSVSHMDKCWQNHFKAEEKKHNQEIPKIEIINEYTDKNC